MSDTGGWSEKYTMDGVPYYHNEITEEVSWDKPNALKSKDELYNESGNWRWVPDSELAWIPARELQKNPDGSVDCENERGEIVVVKKNVPNWPLMKSSLIHLEEDLVLVDNMNEGLIIHNLRERFKKNKIYTYIGTILVSVNPFQRLPLYTPSIIEEYYHSGGNRRLPPHIFGIADSAYKNMYYDKKDQSILISGESGAGKTEATKQCLTFFAEVAGSESNVEQKIIQANPILEAFGNAKTVRNNNSSRFGKYMEIHFDRLGKIVGARTENYLLEKSRVVYQANGERNFHIFYCLVRGNLADKYLLNQPIETFNYLNQSGTFDADDIDDAKNLEEIVESFRILGISDKEVDWLFSIVAAILKLGNIQFDGNDLGSKINPKSTPLVSEVANLLQVQKEALEEAILSRWFVVRGQEPTKIPFKPNEARDACDALAKAIYGETFNWLVKRINEAVAIEGNRSNRFIGVLDIFGFEIFEMNSFEQLCINFANEKLQQHFNQYTFKLEEKVYSQEQIDFTHIEFIDNQPILDLIEKKPNGLLIYLDEEIVMPKGTDETWSRKIVQEHGKHQNFEKIIQKDTAFIIHHYAGAVRYDAEGFLLKNKDTLYQDLYTLISESKHELLKTLFPQVSTNDKNRKVSLGGQFRMQLNNLMDKLNTTQPHYVRCVKPNSYKEPNNFESVMSLEQLRYAGVFEAIRIRQQGYPFRYTHQEFVRRYKCLALKDDGWLPLKSRDAKSLCKELLDITKQDFSTIQIGRTQVLYRAPQQRVLELLRNLSLERVCLVSQSWIRMTLTQEFTRRLRKAQPALREALRIRHDLEKTEAALENASNIIGTLSLVYSFQIKEITDCKFLRDQLIERKRVSELLAHIFPKDPETNFDELTDIVQQADAIADYPGNPTQMKLYADTKAKLELTINRRATRAELTSATQAADKGRINTAIDRARELGIESCAEVGAGKAMLKRIAEEEKVLGNLIVALGKGGILAYTPNAQSSLDPAGLDGPISEATRFGMKTAEGIFNLKLAIFCKKLRTKLATVPWEGSDPWITVEELLQSDEATDDILESPEVEWALSEVRYRERIREVLDPLKAALDALNEKNMKAGLKQFESEVTLGADQRQRIHSLEKQLAGPVQEALERLKATTEALNQAIESEDEAELQNAVEMGANCPITETKAVHLREKYAMATILLALKFHIVEGTRAEVGLMLDEVLANATSAKIATDNNSTAELHKETIIRELNNQSQAITQALEAARNVTFETDQGKTVLQKGKVIKGLRDSLLARNWDQVENFLNQAGSLQIETPDVQLAQDEVAGRAAASDVLAHIEQAIASIPQPSDDAGHPSEGILITSLSQAERLQMKELDQIKQGREMLSRIQDTRHALQKALITSQYDDFIPLAEEYGKLYELLAESIALLNEAIERAESFSYNTKEVRDAQHLLKEFQILTNLQTSMQTGGYLEGNQPSDIPANFIVLDPLSNAYEPTNGMELTTELSHYIVTKSYHVICIRGAIQVLSHAFSHLEEAVAEAGEGIGFETPELISAREILEVVHDINARMTKAETEVVQALLEDAVETAEKYFYENENVERVRQLRDRVIELNEESRQALWNMDKARMEAVLQAAKDIRLTTDHFEYIAKLLDFSEEDFLKLEIKKAREIGDDPRKTRIAIRLKEITLDLHANMFGILQCKSLRSPKDFANQKLVTTDRKKLAMGMMYFSKHPLHTSLLDLPDPLLIKLAKKSFKNIMGFMGDKKYPYPATLAQELIQCALDNPGIRGEIYVQIIKQLEEHPIPANKQQGYHLLAVCCANFPPTPDMENFVEMYLRRVPERSSKYIAHLRDVTYGGVPTTAPTPDQIDAFVKQFFDPANPKGESKFCIPQEFKTTQYTDEFFQDPAKLFLETEVELK